MRFYQQKQQKYNQTITNQLLTLDKEFFFYYFYISLIMIMMNTVNGIGIATYLILNQIITL